MQLVDIKKGILKMEKESYLKSKEFQNIKEIIYNSAKEFANNVAFVIKHKKDKEVTYEDITYKKLLEDINAFGTKLYELGFKNKRIAVVGRNRYEWVVAHLANVLGGIVSVPLDKELQVDELESCLVRSKADVVVFDEKYTVASIFIIKKANTFMIITQGGNKSNVQFHPIFAMWVIIQTAEIFSNSTIRRQK